MFVKKTTLIIPTRNRVKHINKILKQLYKLNLNFNEIIIVDSSEISSRRYLSNICKKYKVKLYFSKPSSSLQRNLGLKLKNPNSKFVMFLDDDVIFYKNSFQEMNKIISKHHRNENIVGFCFNQVSTDAVGLFEKFKSTTLVRKMNLYSNKPGQVTKGGWHTKILNVKKDTISDWVFTTASIYKSKKIKNKFFNISFGAYSYLEDLEFSLNTTKRIKKFIISSKAKFKHPINIDRSNFLFGKIEVINRFKIVKKYKLSKIYFFVNVFLRYIISFIKIIFGNLNYFARSFGNIYAIFLILAGRIR